MAFIRHRPFLFHQSNYFSSQYKNLIGMYSSTWRCLSSSVSMKDVMKRRLSSVELISRQRNAFGQHTFPRLEFESITNDGHQSHFSIQVTQEMCHYDGRMIHAGIIASLMLDITALQASVIDEESRNVLTISSSFDFLRTAKVGEVIKLITQIPFNSHNFVVAEMRIINSDGLLVSTGKHYMKFTHPSPLVDVDSVD